jgi:hypothetical protein
MKIKYQTKMFALDISQTVLNMIRDELLKEGYEMYQPMLGGSGMIYRK